jgi:hypothetical protein
MIQPLVTGDPPSLKAALVAASDEARGTAYNTIIKNVKDLCSRAVHKPEASSNYQRPEALFILRTAESSIALLGNLLSPPSST